MTLSSNYEYEDVCAPLCLEEVVRPEIISNQKEVFESYSSLPPHEDTDFTHPNFFEVLFLEPQSGVASPGTDHVEAALITGDTQEGTTLKTVTDAVVKIADKPMHADILASLKATASDRTDVSIKSFLAKPVEFASGNLATTDTSSTFTYNRVFGTIMSNTMLKEKLRGTFAFRATAIITLTVNATRFQQGRYILAFIPNGGGNNNNTAWNVLHDYDRTIRTQLPHVELDLALDTQVQLRIPYVAFCNAAPVPTDTQPNWGIGEPGRFKLSPYYPLVAGSGSTTASYTLWVHYEDVELLGNMAPQMGTPRSNVRGKSKGNAQQQEQRQPGFVESSARIVGKVADVLRPVPLLSAIAGPVSWVADKVAGVASIFGWSSPLSIEDTQRNHLEIMPYFTHSDAKVVANKLSVKKDNMIEVVPGFASSDVDELAIDYIKDIYAFYNSYDITTATADGAVVATISLSPSTFFNRYAGNSATDIISPTPIAYLSSLFTYYRGGLKFKFKVVKTEFHSGRIMVAFFPYTSSFSGAIAWTTADADYVHKTVIDLRSVNEFEFEVPWVSTTSWKATGNLPTSANATYISSTEPFGVLKIFNLQPLIAPSTVSSTITLLVEVKGAADLSFAVPRSSTYTTILPMAIQAGVPNEGQMDLGVIGGASTDPYTLAHEASTIGEVIASLRSLLKRPTLYTVAGSTSSFVDFMPYSCNIVEDVIAGFTVANVNRDLISQLTPMFALIRGSLRFSLLADDTTTAAKQYWWLKPATAGGSSSNVPCIFSNTVYNNSQLGMATNGIPFAYFRRDWGTYLEIPFYSANHSKPSCSQLISAVTCSTPAVANGGNNFNLVGAGAANTMNGLFYRCGGDDFNLGYFVSTTPQFVPGGTLP